MYNLSQKLVAEFIGTFALIFFGAGAVCVDFHLRSTGGLGLLAIALATGLAIAIMVSALGHISGGHFNPAITLGFVVTRRIQPRMAAAYWVAQFAGATVAALLLRWIYPAVLRTPTHLGAPSVSPLIDPGKAMVLEAVMTFFLVLV